MTAIRQEYYRGFETSTGEITVAGEIWNLKCDYEERLQIGAGKLFDSESRDRWDGTMFAYWLRVEAEYKVVHECFAMEALAIRYNKPPRFKSIGEVRRLFLTR